MTDGAGPYGPDEYCSVMALRPLTATATHYDVESGSDYLIVSGNEYRHTGIGPRELQLEQGAVMEWETDESVFKDGFKVCASIVVSTTTVLQSTLALTTRESSLPVVSATSDTSLDFWEIVSGEYQACRGEATDKGGLC